MSSCVDIVTYGVCFTVIFMLLRLLTAFFFCRACVVKCCGIDFKSGLRVVIVVRRTWRSVMRNRRQFVNLTVWWSQPNASAVRVC